MKKLLSQFLSLTLAAVLCLPVVAQNPRTGQSQDKPLDSKRTGFAPTAVRFANLAAQDVTTWGALSGNAIVTTGVTAPDGTTGAATLSITSPPEGYRRVYDSTRTVTEGDWIIAGVWVKGVALANLDGTTGTLETFNVAALTLYDATEGYRIDSEATNTRTITPPDDLADTQWQWLTTAFKVTSAVPGSQATVRFALNCDNRHSASFYAPVLHHIPVNTITDAEAEGLLQNLYPVAKGATVGTVTTLNSQTFQAPIKDAGGQVFNVKANGATGNGIDDDTTAIQEIIDAAESRSAGDGYYRTVYLPAGTFKVSGLTVSGRVRLQGASDGETVIYSTSNATIIDCSAGSFEMPALENIRIRGDVTAGSSQIGLRLDDGTGTGGLRTLIRNVWIENCGGAGLRVERTFSSIFEGVYATNCAGYPFDYDAANMPSNLFVSCYAGLLRDSAPAGFRIRAGEAVLKSCNGVNSLNEGSKWAIVGKKNGVDGDSTNSGAILDLQDCNLESWVDTGILAYHASLVNIRGNTTFVGQALTTQLNGAITNSATTITVDSTQYFSTAGTVAIDSEHITYTGKTSTTLTGCTRGAHGTSAASHSDNATVTFLKKPIEVEHINEGTDYFAHTLQRGIIEDSVVFKDGPLSSYVRGAAIHANGFAPFQTVGRGARIVGGDPLQDYWNSVVGASAKLSRADSYLSKLTITGTTSITQPGVHYIEVNHSGTTTLTLPWPALYTLGDLVIVKDVSSAGASANNITLQANSGGTVNGSSFVMNLDKQSVILAPDGSNDWRIVATYSPGGSGVTGSGSSTRLAHWSGASSLTSTSGLEYDSGSSVLKSPARFWSGNASASVPAYGFTSDTGTGFYLSATGQLGYASSAANGGAGGNVLLLKGDRVTLNGNRISWDSSETIHDLTGSGSPEGVVTASIGSVYRRSNGSSGTTLYVKESGTGNTGWVASGAKQVQAINAKTDYNATGDGVTDDSTAVNNAVTAALAQGRPLYFPTGTYLGVNLTGITYQLKIFGDGPERTILKASASNTPVIDIGNASSHTIEISDLTIEGAGNTSGSSGHGISVHDQSDGLYNFFLNNVWIKNCGGDGVNVRGQFTNKFKSVFVRNCGGNGFDISGGNTILLDSCYVDDVLDSKVAYRIRAGQAVLLNCNGLDSLGSVSDWAVIGQAIADGDPADTYCELELIGCNVESFKRYGVWAKVGSRVSAKATFFTTSASGSNHVAIKTDFTNNQPGTIDSLCRFTVQGTGTWANGYAIHTNFDIPIMAIGRTDITEFYSDAAATARSLPILGATPISTVPYTYAPKLATDALLYPTDNTGDIGATGANRPRDLNLGRDAIVGRNVTVQNGGQITQSGSVAGFLGLTATNSSTSGQAGVYGVNHSGKNVFLQVFQDGTGIAQMGSDHFPIYIKAAGTNRWYFDDLLFSPLQDNTSDLGAGSTRVKDAFLSGSLNLKERTAPSTPAANTLVLYAKDNGGTSALYYKDDAGTETQVGGGGSGANAALSNLASVAINTTLVSDTNNTDDLGTSSIAWRDLYLAGTFNFLARSDPGSPTNNDFWRSSARNQLSIRNSGQTENLSASMWKSSASVFFDTTTTETSIISDTGVGTKTLAANRLVAGSQIRIKASGWYGTKASSPGTFTVKLKNGGTTMLTIAAFTLPTNVADQNWWIEANGSLNATGSSGVINWTINFYYNDGTGDMKTRTYTVNSTTINTTTTNALDITGQFSVSDVANFWQTDVAIIEIL